MRFYKAIKGTDMYEKYGDDLIYDETVAFRMKTLERRQVEDATAEDLAKEFNELDELDPDIFQALLDMAEMEYDEYEDDRDEVLKRISEKLGVELY